MSDQRVELSLPGIRMTFFTTKEQVKNISEWMLERALYAQEEAEKQKQEEAMKAIRESTLKEFQKDQSK